MKLLISQIIEAVNGKLIGNKDIDNIYVTGVSTDTRTIEEGTLFVPLKGESFDGHKFIDNAFEKGAVCVITQEDTICDGVAIRVKDTRLALGDLARYYRKLFDIKLVAITGSTGKTTTKDMIASVLALKFNVLKTEGNFNNDIGVPLTLFRLKEEHQVAVIEMGMNHFDEISYLSRIAEPDVAIITNIGVSHIENLGSREGILKAKCEIFEYMSPKGRKILNGDDDMLLTLKDREKNICYFSMENKNADIYADNIIEKGIEGISCDIHSNNLNISVDIHIPGKHMVSNAMAAAGVALEWGMSGEQIKAGIQCFEPTKMRMDIIKNGKYTIINDVYNANPNSTKAGIDVLCGVKGRKCCILGDMLELGEFAPKLHREVGEYAAEKGIDIILCIGEMSYNMYEGALEKANNDIKVYYYKNQEEMFGDMANILEQGLTILVKASRGMKFEKTIDKLRGE